jgi:Replication initiator protein A
MHHSNCGAHSQHQKSFNNFKANSYLYLGEYSQKSGSKSPLKHFRYLLKNLSRDNHLPDYSVTINEHDCVTFTNRQTMKPASISDIYTFPVLDPETYHEARIVAPNYDVRALEYEWRDFWLNSGKLELKNPDAAFIGFCKARYKHNPCP